MPGDLYETACGLAQSAQPMLLAAALKSIVVLSAAVVATTLMGRVFRGAAATRHLIWFLAVTSLLLLPAFSITLPAWRILPSTPLAQPSMPALPEVVIVEPQPLDPISRTAEPVAKPWPWSLIIVSVWLVGVMVCLAPLVVGTISLWRIRRRATPITAGPWQPLLAECGSQLQLRRRIVLLQGDDSAMPMTWGIRPWHAARILLPTAAWGWSDERRRVVLLHELAHIKRHDCTTQLITQLACALYWFNPLAWLAARRMLLDRECACDDLVLRTGSKPSDYAEHLLQIATSLQSRLFTRYTAIAMARPHALEGRILAILDPTRSRRSVTLSLAAVVLIVTTSVVVPIAMLQAADQEEPPAAAPDRTEPGSRSDPAVEMSETSVERDEKAADRLTGGLRIKVSISELQPGDYTVDWVLPVHDDGHVSLPHDIGDLQLAGLTEHEAAEAIRRRLAEKKLLKDAAVTVELFKTQLPARAPDQGSQGPESEVVPADVQLRREMERRDIFRTELVAIRQRYGDNHPYVRDLTRRLEATQAIIDAAEAAGVSATSDDPAFRTFMTEAVPATRIHVRWDRPTVAEAFDDIRKAAKINLFANWPALERVGVRAERRLVLSVDREMSVGDAIRLIVSQFVPSSGLDQVTYRMIDGILTVAPLRDLSPMDVRVYDVRDLVVLAEPRPVGRVADDEAAAIGQIKQLIEESVGTPEDWDLANSGGSIRVYEGQLIVRTVGVFHQRIASMLAKMREVQSLRVRWRIQVSLVPQTTLTRWAAGERAWRDDVAADRTTMIMIEPQVYDRLTQELARDEQAIVTTAPSMLVVNNQAAMVRLMAESSYITGYKVAEAGGVSRFEPQLATAEHGVAVHVQGAVQPGREVVAVSVKPEVTTITGPDKLAPWRDAPAGQDLTVAMPQRQVWGWEGRTTVADGGTLMILGPAMWGKLRADEPNGAYEASRRVVILMRPEVVVQPLDALP